MPQLNNRGPRKVKVDRGRLDIFKYFKENNPEYEELSYTQFAKILNSTNKELSRAILEDAFEFLIPGLGNLRIKKYKPNIKFNDDGTLDTRNLSLNFKATNELWERDKEAKDNKQRVFHTNEHSEGFKYRWNYNNYRGNCPNKTAYEFKPSRTNSRRINELIRDPDFTGDYYN